MEAIDVVIEDAARDAAQAEKMLEGAYEFLLDAKDGGTDSALARAGEQVQAAIHTLGELHARIRRLDEEEGRRVLALVGGQN